MRSRRLLGPTLFGALAIGSWLGRVIRTGRPLLGVEPARPAFAAVPEAGIAAPQAHAVHRA